MIRLWYEPFGEMPSAMMIALRSGIAVETVNLTGVIIVGVAVLVSKSLREQLAD